MNKYCFELYKKSALERIFLGYKTINAESADEARDILSEKLTEDYQLAQIYIPQNV